MYSPKELISSERLSIVHRGVAAKNGCIMLSGGVFGADMILERDELKQLFPATALTYVEIVCISREDFFHLLEGFPEEKARMRKRTIWFALRRALVFEAAGMKEGVNAHQRTESMKEAVKDLQQMAFDLKAAQESAEAKRRNHHETLHGDVAEIAEMVQRLHDRQDMLEKNIGKMLKEVRT